MARRHTYGPVPSRRFGLSLGVDLVPYKVCCYDCLYCQVGRTTELTAGRQSFVPPEEVAAEVEEVLRSGTRADCVTLSGSGEPTLHRGLGDVEAALRRVTSLPLVLLTNGGLLWDQEVAGAAARFDVVAPTLAAADQATFARLNRPHPSIDHSRMLEGLRTFSRRFRGQLRLEVMLARGVNDSLPMLRALAELVRSLGSPQVDLNTVVRPPAYEVASPLSAEEMEAARRLLEQAGCRATVIAAPPRCQEECGASSERLSGQRLLETLARRPCTVAQLAAALGLTSAAVSDAVAAALSAGELEEEDRGGERYYRKRH